MPNTDPRPDGVAVAARPLQVTPRRHRRRERPRDVHGDRGGLQRRRTTCNRITSSRVVGYVTDRRSHGLRAAQQRARRRRRLLPDKLDAAASTPTTARAATPARSPTAPTSSPTLNPSVYTTPTLLTNAQATGRRRPQSVSVSGQHADGKRGGRAGRDGVRGLRHRQRRSRKLDTDRLPGDRDGVRS